MRSGKGAHKTPPAPTGSRIIPKTVFIGPEVGDGSWSNKKRMQGPQPSESRPLARSLAVSAGLEVYSSTAKEAANNEQRKPCCRP